MFASDGMRPDLMEKYAKAGYMPTYKKLMRNGVTGGNGMLQAFPPNTGVGWYTMATGAYPADHGSTNNTYFRAGDTFSNRTSFSAAGHDAGRHDRRRRRAGGQEGRPDRLGRRRGREHRRPDRRLHQLLLEPRRPRRRGRPGRAAGSAFFGVNYEVAALAPGRRAGAACRPAIRRRRRSRRPAGADIGSMHVARFAACTNLNRTYNVYLYDSVVGGAAAYDHVIVSPVGKTGASAVGRPRDRRLRGASS